MKIIIKKTIFWIIAVVITIGASVYQRLTGPTYPIDLEFSVGSTSYTFELPRSHGGDTDCPVEIELPDQFTGNLIFRRYPTNETWDTIQLQRIDSTLIAFLPNQPPAGKLEYHVKIYENERPVDLTFEENIVVRFKGDVPAWALLPHVFFMFFAMLWSNATGLQAAVKLPSYKRNALISLILFSIGGLILGPIVQKYAFGAYWTGWPLGEDLTDNKVLVSVIFWVLAVVLNRKKDRPWLVIVAAVFLFAIYMIPHSMRGSELDYETGSVTTGYLVLLAVQLGQRRKKSVKGRYRNNAGSRFRPS